MFLVIDVDELTVSSEGIHVIVVIIIVIVVVM